MSILDNIKNILSEQMIGYRNLLGLLQREKESLLNVNPTAVEIISKEKDTLVLRLKLLEEERIRLTKKFADDRLNVGDVSLRRLFELTGDETLNIMRLQMVSLTQSIAELNGFNRTLIEQSLGFIRNSLNFLDVFGLSPKRDKPGAMLSREA